MEGRPVLSCGSCRQRKLKCDRNQPCSNCDARGSDCVYSSASRSRPAAQRRDGNINLESRLRRLEQLMKTMATQMPPQGGDSRLTDHQQAQGQKSGGGAASSSVGDGSGLPTTTPGSLESRPGRMMSSDHQVAYVSGTHWAALSDEIAEVREALEQSNLADATGTVEGGSGPGPMLLEGLQRPPPLKDILASMPPRDVASRLLSRYFSSDVVSIVILHAPTFEQEYNRFWLDQEQALPVWVGVLYGVLAMGVFLFMRSHDELPGDLGDPMQVLETFQRRSTECLLLSKYSTAPGPYTMEALAMNAQIEFVRTRDANVGVWVLLGIAFRLALRMGYHREPSHYPQFSVFQGEMRRRIWAIILQLDALTSCQIGLPPLIQLAHCDTQPPTNLLDDDFGPDSTQLPQGRPETEVTPVLYTITKTRISNVFRSIFDHVGVGRVESYNQVMELDQRLRTVQKSVPLRFQMASLESSISTPAKMLIHRYSLELLGLKARCILHRHHMTQSYNNPAFNYSRASCVDAAMGIIKLQSEILQEVQDGGRLCQHRWFLSSLETHDLILSCMIVCVELSFRDRQEAMKAAEEHSPVKFSPEQMLEAVRLSQSILEALTTTSNDARKAYNAFYVIVDKLHVPRTVPQRGQGLTSLGTDPSTSSDNFTPHPTEVYSTMDSTYLVSAHPSTETMETFHPAFNSSLEGVDSFFNTPDIADWEQWEAFIQGSRSDEMF